MTQLRFAPSEPENAYLCRNEDSWANVMFEQLGFVSATPGASFFYSYSTGQAQDYRFTECEWTGEWTYGLALDGSNTNSEMRWDACRVGGAYRKAFLYSGLSEKSVSHGQQDQFLNYWFNDMKVEYAWGNFLEFPYGGSITCRGGSYIVTGRRPEDSGDYGRTSTFFRFPRGPHHDSVQRFHAEDIRFEVRDPDTVVIDCAWDSGTVHFNDCDDTANAFKTFAGGAARTATASAPRARWCVMTPASCPGSTPTSRTGRRPAGPLRHVPAAQSLPAGLHQGCGRPGEVRRLSGVLSGPRRAGTRRSGNAADAPCVRCRVRCRLLAGGDQRHTYWSVALPPAGPRVRAAMAPPGTGGGPPSEPTRETACVLRRTSSARWPSGRPHRYARYRSGRPG